LIFLGKGTAAPIGLHTARLSERKRLRFDVAWALVDSTAEAEAPVERETSTPPPQGAECDFLGDNPPAQQRTPLACVWSIAT
jgi:hypothetical protein